MTAAAALITPLLVAVAAPAAHAVTVPTPADPPVTATATVTQYPQLANGDGPTDVAVDRAGTVWFTDYYNLQVDELTPAGTITTFNVSQNPSCITRGPDGNVWFTETGGPIGTISSGGVTEYPRSSYLYGPTTGCIAAGPAGNLWYTDDASRYLATMSVTGAVTQLPFFLGNGGAPPVITAGPDARMWFGQPGASASISAVHTDGSGYANYALPPSGTFIDNATVDGLTAGPDGKMWFTTNADIVGSVTLDGSSITQYPTPYSGSFPGEITTGPDGNIWFTEGNGDRIGRVTPSGEFNEVLLPYNDYPLGLASGDGQLWFGEPLQLASLDPATLAIHPTTPCLTVTHSLVLQHDVGPCTADGIVVTGSNLTINLGGHRVFASRGVRVGDYAGIHLKGATGVTVKNGEVTGFDAGVWIETGGGNTVENMNVHDNLGPANNAANLGDGIVAFHSPNNRIIGNRIVHNGVFDGIAVLGVGSDHNLIQKNTVSATTDEGIGDNAGSGTGIIVNAFLEAENNRRGDSLTGNDILDNSVLNSVDSGISSVSNDGGHIESNRVDGTGPNDPGNGIGVNVNASADQNTDDVVANNTISNVAGAGGNAVGISIISGGNQITHNRLTGLGAALFGINNEPRGGDNASTLTYNYVVGAQFDLFDYDCLGNWFGNTYATARPACTTVGGHQVNPPKGSTGTATPSGQPSAPSPARSSSRRSGSRGAAET